MKVETYTRLTMTGPGKWEAMELPFNPPLPLKEAIAMLDRWNDNEHRSALVASRPLRFIYHL